MPNSVRITAVVAANLLFWIVAVGAGGQRDRHLVVPGDTLSGLALTYEVSVADIVKRNDICNPDVIFPGQSLEIPDSATAADPVPTRESTAPYVVRPGDMLSEIAFRYGAIMAYYQGLSPTLEGRVYDETKRYLDAVWVVRQTFWP